MISNKKKLPPIGCFKKFIALLISRTRCIVELVRGELQKKRRKLGYIFLIPIIILFLGITISFFVGARGGVLWAMFFAFIVYGWDNRIPAALALICLSVCPLFIELDMNDRAENIAVWAFFFLTMTVALQLIDMFRHPDIEITDQNENL